MEFPDPTLYYSRSRGHAHVKYAEGETFKAQDITIQLLLRSDLAAVSFALYYGFCNSPIAENYRLPVSFLESKTHTKRNGCCYAVEFGGFLSFCLSLRIREQRKSGAQLPSCRHGPDGNRLARDGAACRLQASRRSFLPRPH